MTREELNKICEWLDTNITCMQDDTRMFFIERFRKAMDAVVKEPLTWHKASEELPKDTCEVLICWRERNYILHYPQVAMFYGDADKPSRFENENGMPVMPDYWMPIPELPKED